MRPSVRSSAGHDWVRPNRRTGPCTPWLRPFLTLDGQGPAPRAGGELAHEGYGEPEAACSASGRRLVWSPGAARAGQRGYEARRDNPGRVGTPLVLLDDLRVDWRPQTALPTDFGTPSGAHTAGRSWCRFNEGRAMGDRLAQSPLLSGQSVA